MSTSADHDEPIVQTVAEPLHQILKKAAAEAAGAGVEAAPKRQKQRSAPKTLAFRPTGRQPLALLTILDDGERKRGEVIRIRTSRLVIGREQGDVTIPCDGDMSGRHAELRCQQQDGKFQWFLIDLGSTNGTFLRAYRATLSNRIELVVGSRRYRFRLPDQLPAADDRNIAETHRYQAPSRTLLKQFLPQLSEVGGPDDGGFSLSQTSQLIGRDSGCELSVADDPFLSPQHARLYQDERGRWMIEDQKSLNGVWLKIRRLPLAQPAEFQLGQQRFRFQPTLDSE